MNRLRIRWIAWLSLLAVLLIGVLAAVYVVFFFGGRIHPEPWQFLAQVDQLEQSSGDPASAQMLGAALAVLGRDDEVRRLDMFPQSAEYPQLETPRSTVAVDVLKLNVVPWRSGLVEIAAKHSIVMMMEAHVDSKHREFIGATLPILRDAGFTHYAAEAISQYDPALAERGYPNKFTGVYTADPQFGNLLRRAFDLKFTVVGYDYRFTTHEEREEFAAARLAELFQNGAETKLLVHAGYSHVIKHETKSGQRWLASLLWEKTGIEPFTIWQWSSASDAHDYEKVVSVLKARGERMGEPVLLMPPPALDSGLQDSPYGLGNVDAIVVHPPDESVAPAKRTVLFPDSMQRLSGRWTASQWPVVVSAYKKGEPIDAIPLDQVMLRQGEAEFVLWIPKGTEYEIRVFNRAGVLDARVDGDGDFLSVGL